MGEKWLRKKSIVNPSLSRKNLVPEHRTGSQFKRSKARRKKARPFASHSCMYTRNRNDADLWKAILKSNLAQ